LTGTCRLAGSPTIATGVIEMLYLRNLTLLILAPLFAGCVTQKESHTSRTGVEQLLVSSAIDQSLAKIDLSPLQSRKVFLETKYLDCVDKNYIIVSMHRSLLGLNCKMVDKVDESDVTVEIGSGGVGTDSQEMFVGIPEIPLPPPSPIAIPKLAFYTRNKLNGTAKLLVVAYETKSKAAVINSGTALARSDQKTWSLIGTGTVITGSVPDEIAAATGETELNITTVAEMSTRAIVGAPAKPPAPQQEVRQVNHMTPPPPPPAPILPLVDITPVPAPEPVLPAIDPTKTEPANGWSTIEKVK